MANNYAKIAAEMAREAKIKETAETSTYINVIELDPKELIPDPENKEVYTKNEVEGLAESMREDGFFGIILAYPYEGKYKIESGHRRTEAAIKAGLKSVLVMVTKPPKDDIDRRKRLMRANLHNRADYYPMVRARAADYLFTTYEEENKQLAAEGKQVNLTPVEKAARALEISTSNVSRYRKLLKLSEKLQNLLDEYTDLPWTSFLEATELTEEQGNILYKRILSQIKLHGDSAADVTANFVRQQIIECSKFKGVGEAFDRSLLKKYEVEAEEMPKEKASKYRRQNGALSIHKACNLIKNSLDPSLSYIKETRQEEALEELKDLQKYLNNKIAEIENGGFEDEFKRKLSV